MKAETVNRVFNILDTFNHWDILSEDYTPAQLARDLDENPEPIIIALAEIIEEL